MKQVSDFDGNEQIPWISSVYLLDSWWNAFISVSKMRWKLLSLWGIKYFINIIHDSESRSMRCYTAKITGRKMKKYFLLSKTSSFIKSLFQTMMVTLQVASNKSKIDIKICSSSIYFLLMMYWCEFKNELRSKKLSHNHHLFWIVYIVTENAIYKNG